MSNLLDEIKDDLNFIKGHTLQPTWYKILKIIILLGFFVGYSALFGIRKTVIFFVIFFFLSLLIHMLYRVKTNKWKRSWLDFVIIEEDNEIIAQSIGKFYYSAIVINTILSVVISQLLP